MNKKMSLIMASAIATILIAYISALSNQAFAQDYQNAHVIHSTPSLRSFTPFEMTSTGAIHFTLPPISIEVPNGGGVFHVVVHDIEGSRH